MKIAVVGAQFEEINPLLSFLDDIQETTIANQKFFMGQLLDHEMIVVQCGVGKVNASIGATLLIHHFMPDCVINIGSAGSCSQNLDIGDIVVSTECRYHDVDLTPFGYEYGQMSKMPAFFQADENLISIADACIPHLSREVCVKKSLIASGDSFVTQTSNITFDIEMDYCVEMEACAIAQVCHVFNIPFLGIRSISDITGFSGNKDTYEEKLNLASENANTLLLKMIEKLS